MEGQQKEQDGERNGINNQFTIIHINGRYYVYTKSIVEGKIVVNIERVG